MDLTEFSRLSDKKVYTRHPWEIARKEVLFKLINSFNKENKIKKIVDIGGGDGYIINELAKNKFATAFFAIDVAYNEEIVKQLKINNPNQEVKYFQNINEYLNHHPNQKNVLFLCMDVLEHLEDESEILSYLQHKENSNYYLFTVPAFQSLFSNHDTLLGHYRRYNLKQIEKKLTQFNFSIKRSGYFFATLLIIRFVHKIIGADKKKSIDNWNGNSFETNLYKSILLLDFNIVAVLKKIGFNIFGLSCYCICKKT